MARQVRLAHMAIWFAYLVVANHLRLSKPGSKRGKVRLLFAASKYTSSSLDKLIGDNFDLVRSGGYVRFAQ